MSRAMWALFAVVALSPMVVSCSSDEVSKDVLPPAYRTPVRVFIHDHNCRGLQALFDHSNDPDVMTYLDHKMRDIGCY